MPGADQNDLVWLEIDDFTPGIITNSALAYAPNGTGGNTGPVPGKQPGQAQSAVGCIALPNGGLAPLPSLLTPIGNPGVSTPPTICNGFFSAGPLYDVDTGNFFDELIFCYEHNDGTDWHYGIYSIDVVNGVIGTTGAIALESTPVGTALPGWVTFTGDTTRANATPTDPGLATLALGYWWHDGTDGRVLLYPDPTTPMSHAPYVLANTVQADVICHQNRIVTLQSLISFWGSSILEVLANEAFDYTDPPNSLSLGTQSEVFVQEHPFGTGSWGSISASELFLVKHSGGGYVIQGDLNAPTVTRLPAVTSTYGLMSRAGDTTIGLVYASNNRGLWAWNGGLASQKISNQLDDNFFINTTYPNPPGLSRGPSVDITGWGDWIVCTNDWLFDTNTGGWWKLSPSLSDQAHIFYRVSGDGNYLYAACPVPTSSIAIDLYSRLAPETTFSWTSYPIRLPQATNDRQFAIRNVVIRAQGNGTVAVTLTGYEGATSEASPSNTLTFEATSDSSQPRMQELAIGLTAQDVTISIVSTANATSTSPAPIVYSVAIGYIEQQQVSST